MKSLRAARVAPLTPFLMLCALGISGLTARAATRTVTSLADSGAGSLRDQVAAAAAGDTINFGVTGTIELNSPSIAIAKDLTITGPGAGNLTISGNGTGNGTPTPATIGASIFRIGSGVVGISGLKISDGTGDEDLGGAIRMSGGTTTLTNLILANNYGDSGGGVYLSGGSMALDGCTFSGNNSEREGGAIAVKGGAMTLGNSTLSGNNSRTDSGVDGGAINLTGGSLSINRTSISGSYGGFGGGIYQLDSTLNIANSTISGNTAIEVNVGNGNFVKGWGGGIFNGGGGPLSITNSTISGNRALGHAAGARPGGGGIWNQDAFTLTNSTVVGNYATGVGGGINSLSNANISNSIIAGNFADKAGSEPDFSGNAVGDYNLIQRLGNPASSFSSGTHNIYGKDAQLGPLQNNGGPTKTYAPLTGSPVLDAGDPGFDTFNLPFDQRGAGFPRQKGSRIDIGAVEGIEAQGGNNFVVNSLADTNDGVCGTTTDCTLREAIANVPTGGTITFGVTGTITLTGGELIIFRDMTIQGPTNSPGITLSGNNQNRILTLGPVRNANGSLATPLSGSPSRVDLFNLTLRDGNAIGNYLSSNGGALFIDNTSPVIQATVANCTFSGNSASSSAGVTNSGNGGAIRNGGALTVTNSTFYGNSAGNNGGAIRNGTSTLTVTNSTISGNSAGTGRGGGIDNNGGTVNLSNTLVAGNSATTGPDVGGVVNSAGYNFVGKGEGNTGPAVTPATNPVSYGPTPLVNGTSGNQVGTSAAPLDPKLGALADNGGPTFTVALLTGSSAINRGSNSLVPSGVTNDQRGVGFARIFDGTVDIGAFEMQPQPPTISIAPNVTQDEGNSGTSAMTFAVTRSGNTAGASTVAYSVVGDSATAGSDYTDAVDSDGGSPGVLNFGAGQTSASISVPIVGDQGLERDETFTVTLSAPTGAALGTTAGLGTIRNDDSGLVVTTLADTTANGNDNDNTLREAIARANSAASGTDPVISFASNVRGELLLGMVLPSLTKNMTITGPGAGLLTVRPTTEFAFVVFTNGDGISSTLSGLTVSKGFRGVVNSGALTMVGCVVTGNRAATQNQTPLSTTGGGIQSNGGSLTMTGCTVSNNTASEASYEAFGGGIYADAGASVNLTGCTLSGNTASGGSTTVSGGRGGGIYVSGTLNASNCTLSGNTATGGGTTSRGGGIYQDSGTVSLANCTVSGNTAKNSGGGLYRNGGTFNLGNTIVAVNTSAASPDASGTFTSQGYNLIGNSSGADGFTATGDQSGVDPMLGALADNGGPTQTMALSTGSPAINAGDPAFSGSGKFDQRGTGFPRVIGGRLDIGAFESSFVPAITDVSASISVYRSGASRNRGTGRYKETVLLKNTSASAVSGPFYLVLDNLSANATLFNASGTTTTAPVGNPYLTVPIASLPAGASQYVVLEFTVSNNMAYSFSPRVLAGNGSP